MTESAFSLVNARGRKYPMQTREQVETHTGAGRDSDTLMRAEPLAAPPRHSRLRVPMMRRAVGERTSTEPPGRGAALARSGRRLTAGLLLAFVGLLALLSGYENAAANSAPTFDDGTSTSRQFNETIGDATVGTASDIGMPIAATDTDTSDTLEYTLSGTDAAKFTVDMGNGQIKTVVGETYDHEAKASYAVTVTVEDGNGGSATIDVTLTVTDQDEAPLRPAAPTVRGPTGNSTTSLSVTMTAPDNSGRPPITRYKLRTHRDGFGWTNLPYNPSSAQIITGITSGKRYHVQFRVKNDEGEAPPDFGSSSRASAPSRPATERSSPRAPRLAFATTAAMPRPAPASRWAHGCATPPARSPSKARCACWSRTKTADTRSGARAAPSA